MFLVAEDLGPDRTQTRLDTIAAASSLSALALFIPALVCPYHTYGHTIDPNFFDSLYKNPHIRDNTAVVAGRLLLGVAELSAFPLQLFPCRKSILVILSKIFKVSKILNFSISLFILIFCVLIGIFVTNLGILLKLVGLLGSNTICFIMPTFFYCAMFRHKKDTLWYVSAFLCCLTTALIPAVLPCIIITYK